ncbi:type IV secretory system conjugative DNA transfer family protein [Labedaea rhizosphaerae]|uniref:Uncharacterized protein n=1 Tax=Labedaea rhizosphaerae TaxID=598644 RepID=A0A4R6SBJ9_LABRH|nr:type IV secretory system conjugative DNA transfer family protein [Labedaea rhizosphaerae]TDP96386.1 hypothetical protein EV186_104371 [Labedaea rhizosphaerae]
MIELSWFEAFPPRDTSAADLTNMLRVLAGRPHYGLRRLQPLVVFELWMDATRVRWLLGVEPRIARTLPGDLQAQLAGLVLLPADVPARPAPVTAREVRLTSMIHPLRLDTAASVMAGLANLQTTLRSGEAVVVQWVMGPSHTSTRIPIPETPFDVLGFTKARQPDGEDARGWKSKLGEPIFGVRARVGAVATEPRRAAELLRPTVAALGLASGSHARVYASPQSSRTAQQLADVMGRVRTFSGIANASELAILMGWSLDGLEVPGSPGAFALPPASLLRAASAGAPRAVARPLGVSTHPAAKGAAVWLPRSSFATHSHVMAPSGAGKSTLLAAWILAEADAGGSLVAIEPKGDLVTDVLARLPRHRHRDVVVIDPGANGPVTGFNPLRGPRGDAERRADSLLGLLRVQFGSAIGPRSADVLLHALILAARLEDGAVTDILPILTNPHFRRWVASKVGDPLITRPWLAWLEGLSDGERAQVVMPVANKIRPWSSRSTVRRLLSQADPKFDLASVFTRPTIVLVNLNAGAVGPETARLLGSLILSQLWEAVQRQTTKPAVQRRPVSVFVDEWQAFTGGVDFADVLARSRGAGVSFTLANQHLGQLSTDLQAAVLANVGARVVFRPAEGDGRVLARVLGAVKPEDLERLPAYHAVARVLVDGAPSRAFEIALPPLPAALHDPDEVRRASAARFGTDPAELDAAILKRWQGGDPPATPVGVRRTGV